MANLLEQEVEALLVAVAKQKSAGKVLGTLIRAFHSHYVDRLGEFRAIYCSTQMYAPFQSNLDEITLREKIHPRTRQLFDDPIMHPEKVLLKTMSMVFDNAASAGF